MNCYWPALPKRNASRTLIPLHFLAFKRYKVNKRKWQLVQQTVQYLGHVLSPQGHLSAPERIFKKSQLAQAVTNQDIYWFLGAVRYWHAWVPNVSLVAKPLHQVTRDSATNPVSWTPDKLDCWRQLKTALMQSPALGFPNYVKPLPGKTVPVVMCHLPGWAKLCVENLRGFVKEASHFCFYMIHYVFSSPSIFLGTPIHSFRYFLLSFPISIYLLSAPSPPQSSAIFIIY